MSEDVLKALNKNVSDDELTEIILLHLAKYRDVKKQLRKKKPSSSGQIQQIVPLQEENEEFDCPVCFESVTSENKYVVMPCKHTFCLKCVTDHIVGRINNGEIHIKCPESGCGTVFPANELFQNFLTTEELREKYDRNSVNFYTSNHADECKYCPLCNATIVINPNKLKIQCPICNKDFCLKCQCKYHDGLSCEDYQKWKKNNDDGDKQFEEWLKANGATCPRCKLACQRISGCNWIYCNPSVGGCGCGYCYKCGKEVDHYSPHILRADCSLSPKQK